MWREEGRIQQNKVVRHSEMHRRAVLASGECESLEFPAPSAQRKGRKLSGGWALVLGAVLTLELLVLGSMVFNFDFLRADHIAVLMGSVLLYSAVVALLTDR